MKRPKRVLLSEQVAEILTEEILNNRWGRNLPGYRKLCAQLGVGRGTVEGGIEILTNKGILLPSDQSRTRRCINPHFHGISDTLPQSKMRLRTAAGSAREELLYEDRQIIYRLQQKLGRDWNFAHCQLSTWKSKRPERQLNSLIENNPNSRWIFFGPTIQISRWIERNSLDAICIGGETGDTNVPCLTVYCSEIAATLLKPIFELGHRRVCIPAPAMNLSGKFEASIGAFFESYQIPFNEKFNVPRVPNDPHSLWEHLTKLFEVTPPTAMIALNFNWYLAIISFCHFKSIDVPTELFLAVGEAVPEMKWLNPLPPTIEFPVSKFVRALHRWATSSSLPLGGETCGSITSFKTNYVAARDFGEGLHRPT